MTLICARFKNLFKSHNTRLEELWRNFQQNGGDDERFYQEYSRLNKKKLNKWNMERVMLHFLTRDETKAITIVNDYMELFPCPERNLPLFLAIEANAPRVVEHLLKQTGLPSADKIHCPHALMANLCYELLYTACIYNATDVLHLLLQEPPVVNILANQNSMSGLLLCCIHQENNRCGEILLCAQPQVDVSQVIQCIEKEMKSNQDCSDKLVAMIYSIMRSRTYNNVRLLESLKAFQRAKELEDKLPCVQSTVHPYAHNKAIRKI